MTATESTVLPWHARNDVRLAAFGLAALGAVYVGFLAVPVRAAEAFIRQWGYYAIALTFFWWCLALWQARSGPGLADPSPGRGRARSVACLIGLFAVIACAHEEFRSKILNDEFVVQSTAYNMHFFRDTGTMMRGYDLLGTFASMGNYLDKRPYFFPFLLSLVHDLTGYRPANVHVMNALLYPVTLALAAWLGRLLAGWRGALLVVALLGSLPLLAQNATGTGLELLNLAMILLAAVLGARYLAAPGEERLSAFVLAVVLLAQARYESALYVAPAAGIILLGWLRERRIILSWAAVASPVLLVPLALHNKVLANAPVLWELKENQTSRFSSEYLAGNLAGAGRFFLSRNLQQANSLLFLGVAAVAVVGLAVFAARGWRRWRELTPVQVSLLCFGAGMLASTVLVQFYYWASFDNSMAARFSLPLHFVLAFGFVPVAARLDRWAPVSMTFVLAALVGTLGWSVPKEAYHLYSHVGIDECEWERRFVAARPATTRLIITNKSPLPWLLDRTPAVLLGVARGEPEKLAGQLRDRGFAEILVTQGLRPSTPLGDHQVVPEDRLPDGFRLELVAEKRFGTKIDRISRLVAVEAPGGTDSAP